MRLVYLANAIIPSKTANSIHIMKMCHAFSITGNDVTLIVPDRQGEYEQNIDNVYEFYGVEKNFNIIKLKYFENRYINKITYIYGMYKTVKEINPDIVYGRELYGCFLSSFQYNTSYEVHSLLNGFFRNKIFELMIVNKYYDKTVVISKALQNVFISTFNINANNIYVAHDGADEVKDFHSKVQLKGKSNNLKIGYIGHLYKGKGIELIEKLQYDLEEDMEIHIVGGYENDIDYWKNRITVNNIYFYGFISQKNVSKYINSMDICLLPNQKVVLPHGTNDVKNNISDFTSPLKMFEYMAHKKAIVASDLAVLKEVLNTNNSILCSVEDYKQWLDAFVVLRNKKEREKISDNAYSLFQKHFSWKSRAKNLLNKIYW
jgi:glycosyltransferase involved in cell wall biosynthesis